jgi:hypothetical protein
MLEKAQNIVSKYSLMANTDGISEQNADKNVNSKGYTSGGNEDRFQNWIRDLSCYILMKNLSIYCSGPESLWET